MLIIYENQDFPLALQSLFHSHSHGNGSADHGVVAHAQEAHHFYVSGNGGGASELGVRVHTAHGVGHAVGSGTGSHVVGMQSPARAAAGGHGEVLLALLDALLLVGACHGMLEPGGVGGVAGDGHVHALVVHDGHALADIVSAEAADSSPLAVGVLVLLDDLQLAGVVVELGLNIGEAVDPGDDLGSVLTQAVQDDPQGLLPGLVGAAGNADSTLSGSEGLVTGQEREALGLVPQQHSAQVAMAQAHLPVLGHGAVDAEGLQADADGLGGLSGGLNALLQRNGSAHGVGPASVLEADGLNALDDLVGIEALSLADLAALFHRGNAILGQDAVDLVDSSLVTFKQSHCCVLLLFLTGVDVLRSVVEAAVVTLGLGVSRVGIVALLHEVHHLAQVYKLIANDQVVLVQSDPSDIALGHLQVTGALGPGGKHGAHLAAQALAQVFQRSTDYQAALGERGLAAAIGDLQEQLPHGGVDGVAHQVGVQSLQDGLADEDLGGHSCGMGHAGAADGLHQSLLNDALLDVQGQLAGALLRSTPADTVGEAADVLDLLGLYPLALFRNGSGAVVSALSHGAHILYFCTVNHGKFPFFQKTVCLL